MCLHSLRLLPHGIHFRKRMWKWGEQLDHWVINLSKERRICNRTWAYTSHKQRLLTNEKLRRYTHFLGHNCSLKRFTNHTAQKLPSELSHWLSTRNWLFQNSKIPATWLSNFFILTLLSTNLKQMTENAPYSLIYSVSGEMLGQFYLGNTENATSEFVLVLNEVRMASLLSTRQFKWDLSFVSVN